MVTVMVDCAELTGEVATEQQALGALIHQQRELWNESEGPQMFWFRGTDGTILATMLRDAEDSEVCHTLYCDGTVEHHRCHYVLDAAGAYERTEITEL